MTPKVAEPEYAYSGGIYDAMRGKPAWLRVERQATQPALPPTQAADERAPSERCSEAERQRG